MITIETPFVTEEISYIIDVIFNTFYGVPYKIQISKDQTQKVIISKGKNKLISSFDFFLNVNKNGWLSSKTLPAQPISYTDISQLNLLEDNLPILFGNDNLIIENDTIEIGLDLFGSSFFMLSNYEEGICKKFDKHNRFSANGSFLMKENLLMRPIVNEYVEFLWVLLVRLFPDLSRKEYSFEKKISCDVDHIFDMSLYSFKHFVKKNAVNILVDKSLKKVFNSFSSLVKVRALGKKDSFNTFDYTMDICEKNGLKQCFYFICGHSAGDIDGFYDIKSSEAKSIIRNIYDRGHEIGIHFSYNSYKDYKIALKETESLFSVLEELNISTDVVKGSRQHFLRWNILETPNILDRIGLNYDTTLGFADHIGYRTGTCYEYPMYDIKNRLRLKLIQRPLIFMECSLISPRYMNKRYSQEGYDLISELIEKTKYYNGTFAALWHNSFFENKQDFEMFEFLINY